MLHALSISLATCPEGWLASAAKGSSSCYRIAPKPAGQEACQNECRSLHEGASLVCIRSIEEQLFLANQFPSQPSCCGSKDQSCCLWIGLFQSPTNKGSSVGWYAAHLEPCAESAHTVGPHCTGTTGGVQVAPAPTGTGSLASPTTGSPTKTAPLSGGRACPHGSMPAASRSSPASASSSHRSPHHRHRRHRRHQCHSPRPPRRRFRRPSRPLRPIHRRRRSSARPAFCSPTPQECLG
jgi:hypothetical protein